MALRNIWRNEQPNHWQWHFIWMKNLAQKNCNAYQYVCAQILRFSSHIVVKPSLYLDGFQFFFLLCFFSVCLSFPLRQFIEYVTGFVVHLCRTKTMLKTTTWMSFDDIIANRDCYKYLRHPIESWHTLTHIHFATMQHSLY